MIIGRLPNAKIDNIETKNAILAEAYWHRAFWYFHLTMKFGNIPWVGAEVKEPKVDFYTYTRESILEKIKSDLEYAVEWLPDEVLPGKINRAAGYYLLTKVYMTTGEFGKAITAASEVIDDPKYELMTERFGQGRFSNEARFNVVWDLFEKENISDPANKEKILVVQNKYGLEGNQGLATTRVFSPLWWWGVVRDPDGMNATRYQSDRVSDTLGRGAGHGAPSNYYKYELSKLEGDLRYSNENWWSMDKFIYNVKASRYYGQTIQPEYIGVDTIRCLWPFRYDKIFIPEEGRETTYNGGYSDLYFYRLAGLYLLRAEAYWYMGSINEAADDINMVRSRSNAPDIEPSDVDIGTIFDERARELYTEERRFMEMQRASYILASHNMMGYSLENIHEKNWWYDRTLEKNNFYREKISYNGTFNIEPYLINMPIPQSAIDANVEVRINQNLGYPGAEGNIEPETEIIPSDAEKELRDDL
jgi:starch-binding outer membrane protein, SusD/RagB family